MSSPVDEVKKTNLECTNALGQLIRVNDPHENATWVYNYDRGGNILSKVRYAYTTGTLGTALETTPYAYGDANWKDKLTAYNGKAITYDAIGNPLTDGTWTYQWQAGRQLKRMSTEGKAVSFKYDHNGMRIQKVLEHSWYPETTNYTYHGKLLTHMTVDYTDWDEVAQQDKLHFFYDAQSRPVKIGYNGVIYTYVHNLQGDIVGILDSTGALVVEYKYDAWGKLLSTTGSLADTLGRRNPFRYRDYVYDVESGLYYLKSRFYNPNWSRFISKDSFVSNSRLICKNNLFAYCSNVPVISCDQNGKDAYWITDSSNVAGMGHTSLLIQEEDKWFYFYWGPNLDDPSLYAKAYYVEVNILEDDVLGSLNSEASKTEYAGIYDSAILFEGDFTKTAVYCRNLKRKVENTGLPAYGVIDNNCMQVSARAMKESYNMKDKEYWLFRQIVTVVVPNLVQTIVSWFGKKTINGPSGAKSLNM